MRFIASISLTIFQLLLVVHLINGAALTESTTAPRTDTLPENLPALHQETSAGIFEPAGKFLGPVINPVSQVDPLRNKVLKGTIGGTTEIYIAVN
ncbi:hypothetical protein ABEB36_002901 [Hypothenemus hampei]|uniref:Uncharacterized protein n=1 Tax=Hypothenemus hampei TaxID=57062 RepID=A0ABD1F7D1_HYPHA